MPTQKHTPSKAAKDLEKKKKLKKDEGKEAKAKPVKSKKAEAADAASVAREKLKKRGKGAGEVDGDEVEEKALEMMGSAEVDADAEKDEADEEPVRERKEVQDLLAAGKQKGFITYDEVNDALPADVVSSDQIDDVMSMFGDNDIEVVDAQKSADAAEVKPTVAAEGGAHRGRGGGGDDEERRPLPP